MVQRAELAAVGNTIQRYVENTHQLRLAAKFKLPSKGTSPAKRLLRNNRG
jgi:hypothetical protein